jgi:hypothetical protein
MDPTVVAAWIAAGVSVLTLVGTLAAQYLGYRWGREEKAAKQYSSEVPQPGWAALVAGGLPRTNERGEAAR